MITRRGFLLSATAVVAAAAVRTSIKAAPAQLCDPQEPRIVIREVMMWSPDTDLHVIRYDFRFNDQYGCWNQYHIDFQHDTDQIPEDLWGFFQDTARHTIRRMLRTHNKRVVEMIPLDLPRTCKHARLVYED